MGRLVCGRFFEYWGGDDDNGGGEGIAEMASCWMLGVCSVTLTCILKDPCG
jgi:hypothetical protein